MLVQNGQPDAKRWLFFQALASRTPSAPERASALAHAAALQARHGYHAAVLDSEAPPGAQLVDPHHVMVRGLPWWRAELLNAVAEGLDVDVVGDRWEPGFTAHVVGRLDFVLTFRALYAFGALRMALYMNRAVADMGQRLPHFMAPWTRARGFAQAGFACGLTIELRAWLRQHTPPAALIVHPDPSHEDAPPDPKQRGEGVTSEYEKFFRTPDPFGLYRQELVFGKLAASKVSSSLARLLPKPDRTDERTEENRAARLGRRARPLARRA
ncbi:MAG: hypothetical protein EKK55_01180 [Rhodocyclaceae bacterium]|nr:MAG: hypothetical protein EKK55_01180 [Rhodocyclaceae bacterium]